MTYALKGGEAVRKGVLFGWTGGNCGSCNGTGEIDDDDMPRPCRSCGGTGEEWGVVLVQPADLPEDTE